MIISTILAVISWFIFKKIWISMIVFYSVTGIKKSRLWLSIPIRYLPPSLKKQNLGTFIYGMLFWPIILIVNRGDPSHEYFRNVDSRNDHLV